MTPHLRISNRAIESPFGLLGSNENALSFALGYTFQQAPSFLQHFLKQIDLRGIQTRVLRNARIDLQRCRTNENGQAVTDIEIHLPGYFHIIVEAKIGLGIPSLSQCEKYLPHFADEPIQLLVALIQSPDDSFIEAYSKQNPRLKDHLRRYPWASFLTTCTRMIHDEKIPESSKQWVQAFYTFLDREYRMKAFTTEVWLLPVNTAPLWKNGLSFWDIHQQYLLYFDSTSPTVRPLYVAFRVDGIVDSLYRVHSIEHNVRMIDVVPELSNLRRRWTRKPMTVWNLDEPVQLPDPLRTGGGMFNRRVRCDLDLLLSCRTVDEIEKSMSERRNSTG